MANPNWVKGKSGNPHGRPRKDRALTELLQAAGSKQWRTGTGVEIPARKLLAQRIWEAALNGQVVLEDKTIHVEGFQHWFELVKWVYAQIDGPMPNVPELPESAKQRFADELLERVAAYAYDDAPV